jgi:hypothetical protein
MESPGTGQKREVSGNAGDVAGAETVGNAIGTDGLIALVCRMRATVALFFDVRHFTAAADVAVAA